MQVKSYIQLSEAEKGKDLDFSEILEAAALMSPWLYIRFQIPRIATHYGKQRKFTKTMGCVLCSTCPRYRDLHKCVLSLSPLTNLGRCGLSEAAVLPALAFAPDGSGVSSKLGAEPWSIHSMQPQPCGNHQDALEFHTFLDSSKVPQNTIKIRFLNSKSLEGTWCAPAIRWIEGLKGGWFS